MAMKMEISKMRKNKIVFMFMAMMIGWLTIITPVSAQSSNPVSMLQTIANNMINGLRENKANLKNKPQVVYDLAYKYVVPSANLNEMSRRVLPPRIWNSATDAQRKEFQQLFTKTVIRTYASALSNYQDQTIKFYPVRGGVSGNTVEVHSQIMSGSRDPISVTYRLVRSGGGWKLYDMSVEGVSMLGSFRAQFANILAQGDMNTLLQRLSGHTTR
jgi:phospholipid transport system substrate-binding protein